MKLKFFLRYGIVFVITSVIWTSSRKGNAENLQYLAQTQLDFEFSFDNRHQNIRAPYQHIIWSQKWWNGLTGEMSSDILIYMKSNALWSWLV